MPLNNTYKVQLKRVKDGIGRERIKIPQAPAKEGYKPFIWNSLEGYYDMSVTDYLINCPKEDMHPQVPYSWVDKSFDGSLIDVSTRKTTLCLVDPIEDLNMAREILPKLREGRPITRESKLSYRSRQKGDRPPTNDSADRQRIWETLNFKLPRMSPESFRRKDDSKPSSQTGEGDSSEKQPYVIGELTEENLLAQPIDPKAADTKVKLPRKASANSKRRETSPYRTAYQDVVRTSVSQRQSRERVKSSKTRSSKKSREIFSPERGRILLPEIHKVEFDVVNENATEEFPYSGVRRFREKIHQVYDIDTPKRVAEEYRKTKKDFYLMKLHKLADVHPSNRASMRKAYFAYLQNNPGSKKAVKDCMDELVAAEPDLRSTAPSRTTSTSPVRTGAN